MATLILSAVGASLGAAVGGSVLGLSAAVIGRAVGATVGNAIDQRLMGQGSDAIATGKVDRFRLNGAGEGDAVSRIYGRMRLGGQVIWASRFKEIVTTSGGSGKGLSRPKSSTYSYSVSAAYALCEGEISRIGRIWADGNELPADSLTLRVYTGSETQLADAKIAAVEGIDNAPAYRGTAYVVIEDLDLGRFGNRLPQFNFEVFRKAQPAALPHSDLSADIHGVALIPGTGEYALATTPVHVNDGPGVNRSININSVGGATDLEVSLATLRREVPGCQSVSLVTSWFGDDLRATTCSLRPKVEQSALDGVGMPWSVSGEARATAKVVSQLNGRPVYGGTPNDAAVVEAIAAIRAGGQRVLFYPFILMDIQTQNGLSDPWSGAPDQPVMPWRGRITLGVAPGQEGSVDGTVAAAAEVAAFFGTATPNDFQISGSAVTYSGPNEWSYRRFILHYANLCAAAGGVDSFCIGSEMRSLTQIRGTNNDFPAVHELIALLADVRAVLGSETKLGYAADWSEYFGYQPTDGSGDVFFHLDDLWADPNTDFIGIDNYVPLSDWRDGDGHLDQEFGSIYALDYLKGNVAGGEGYDWYYASAKARTLQLRSPIVDGNFGEDWVYRYKDIKGWWLNAHHARVGGVRDTNPTPWQPQSKPIWFTELGCPAIDKGTNQPNVFLDPKSSESKTPYFSKGTRDDFIQAQYLRATIEYWGDDVNNPVSELTGLAMVDMGNAHVWAWDSRPWPAFPGNGKLWSDGENYGRGHWISGRLSAQSLALVVAEICENAGVSDFDVSGLYGTVRGYIVDDLQSARAALQPLMLAFGFEAVTREGVLVFQNRTGLNGVTLDANRLVFMPDAYAVVSTTRAPEAETAGQVRLGFVQGDSDYRVGAVDVIAPDETAPGVTRSAVPLVLSEGEAKGVVARWLAESRIARDRVSFALPLSNLAIGAGDVVTMNDQAGAARYRIDRVEDVGARVIEAVRVEPAVYHPFVFDDGRTQTQAFVPPVPVFPLFLDLPLLRGTEDPGAPHIAVTASPWPGSVAVYASPSDADYVLNRLITRASVIGVSETPLLRSIPGRWDNGIGFRVKIYGGELSSAPDSAVLNGANAMAIGSGSDSDWEIIQFADATLVGPSTYQVSRLLRGQAGSDAVTPDTWPAGSLVVLLGIDSTQIDLTPAARDLARHYRVGPALRSFDDPSYVHEIHAFSGVGLRPYAPALLRGSAQANGDLDLTWIRRTRVAGDSWGPGDVPLGESFESYRVRIMQGGAQKRVLDVSGPQFTYTAAMQSTDALSIPYAVEVSQISERYGAGSIARIDIDA